MNCYTCYKKIGKSASQTHNLRVQYRYFLIIITKYACTMRFFDFTTDCGNSMIEQLQ